MCADRPRPGIGRRTTWAVCGALSLLFVALSYSAVLTKSATSDEPYHVAGGFMRLRHGDYRFNVEDPPLFGYLAAMTLPDDAIRIPYPGRAEAARPRQLMRPDLGEEELYRDFPAVTMHQWVLVARAFYQTPGVDADALIDRARLPFALLGAVLVLLTSWWAHRLAGGVAAIAAAALIALDPNFLAHAPLVKNDVPITLLMVAMMVSLWRIGQRVTLANVAVLVAVVAAAFNTKFSGVLFAPIAGGALLIRALVPAAWPVRNRSLATRGQRLVLALAIGLSVAAGTVAGTWASYGFRFAPHRDPAFSLDTGQRCEVVARRQRSLIEIELRRQGLSEEQSIAEASKQLPLPLPLPVRLALWIEENRLLPQAWTNGLVYTYASALIRSSFLHGEHSLTGWRSYFPLAMWWKTPLATLAAVLLLPLLALGLLLRRGWRPAWSQSWAAICVGLAPAFYGANAILTNLNLGLRHVLPVYPFLFVVAAVSLTHLLPAWRRSTWVAAGMALALAAESLTAWPDFLPFFNRMAGGARGGFHLLSDSNLDWGQDLKHLAEWRARHRDQPLFVSAFGIADPRYYVPDAVLLPGGFVGDSEPPIKSIPAGAYIAISASCLQGTYAIDEERAGMRDFIGKQQLIEVLGGSTYIYRALPPPGRSGR
jgi:4-amino-4-deoxy-L-arabinose transferase-like glycosyltransferase